MAEVKIIREKPRSPNVTVELSGASLAWDTAGHSAQPTPRGTPYVGLSQRVARKKCHQQQADPGHCGMGEEPQGHLLTDSSGDTPLNSEDHTLHVPTISQRLQRTLHCIDLTIEQVQIPTITLQGLKKKKNRFIYIFVCVCVCVCTYTHLYKHIFWSVK